MVANEYIPSLTFLLHNPIMVMEMVIVIMCTIAIIRSHQLYSKPYKIVNIKRASQTFFLQAIFVMLLCIKVMAMIK